MGGMWSPVEDRKVDRKETILLQSEPRHPRPKPPSMLELDSGSSYESRDISFNRKPEPPTLRPGQSFDVLNRSPLFDFRQHDDNMGRTAEAGIRASEHEVRTEARTRESLQDEKSRESSHEKRGSRDASQEDKSSRQLSHESPRDGSRQNNSRMGSTGSQKSPSHQRKGDGEESDRRRRSLYTERRSHSLDSSIEDYHSSSQEKDTDLTQADETAYHYTAMTAHDRRLKLQEQRRSRSLDTYEPHRVNFQPVAHLTKSSSRSKEKILDSSQMRRKSRQDINRAGQESNEQKSLIKDEPQDAASRSRRASDIVSCRANRRSMDPPSGQPPRRASDFVSSGANVHRRTSETIQKSPSRRPSEVSGRISSKGNSPANRHRGDVSSGRGSPSQRRSAEHDSGRGSPSQTRTGERSGSGSPSRRQSESGQRLSDHSRRNNEAKKAFIQQKSFSFEVTTSHPKSEHVVRNTRLKTMPESSAIGIRPRATGRLLPKIPPGAHQKADQSQESSPARKPVEKVNKSKDMRSRFAEQKSFSCDAPGYLTHTPPPVSTSHRKSEPAVVVELNRRRDYMDESELPTHIHMKNALPERHGDTGGGPLSPRGRNVRQEAVDRVTAVRAATSPAAFSLSMQQSSITRSSLQVEQPRDNLTPKGSPREGHREVPRGSPREGHREGQKGSPREGPKLSPREASKISPREGAREGSSPHRLRKTESLAVGPDRSPSMHHSPQDQARRSDNRRQKFGQQKSFSYEVASTYQPLNGEQYNEDYTRGRTARDKRLIMMQTRASHSLDDIDYRKQMSQMQAQYNQGMYQPHYGHFPPPLGYMYMGQLQPHYGPDTSHMPQRYDNSLHVNDHKSHSRSPSRSPDRGRDTSPRASRNALMMMHSMKAVAQDNTAISPPMSPPQHMLPTQPPISPKGYPMPPPHDYRVPIEGMYPPHPYYGYAPMYDDPRYVPQGFYMDERFIPRGYPPQFAGYPPHLVDPHLHPDQGADGASKQTLGSELPPDDSSQPPRSPREPTEPPPEPEPLDDFETKPTVVGPMPAVLIKPISREALRKERYTDGKPFWKFWKS